MFKLQQCLNFINVKLHKCLTWRTFKNTTIFLRFHFSISVSLHNYKESAETQSQHITHTALRTLKRRNFKGEVMILLVETRRDVDVEWWRAWQKSHVRKLDIVEHFSWLPANCHEVKTTTRKRKERRWKKLADRSATDWLERAQGVCPRRVFPPPFATKTAYLLK